MAMVVTGEFQNVGGKGIYDVLTSEKSRGGKNSPRGAKDPPPTVTTNYFYVSHNYYKLL